MPKKYKFEEVKNFIGAIKSNIDSFKNGINNHISDQVVLVLGPTGAGKGTIINMLAKKQIEIFKEKGAFRIDIRDKDYAGEIKAASFLPIRIGHDAHSETQFPNYVMVEGKQFWDCPGFGDNRGPEVEISNMYYILHYAASKEGVKFVIVQDNASTHTGGGEVFKDSIKMICKMFPSKTSQELINATTFVFTKVSATEEQGDEYLKDMLDRVTSAIVQDDDQRVVEFLNTMSINICAIRHIEVPEIDLKQESGHTDYIVDSLNGMISSIVSQHTMQSSKPQFTITPQCHIKIIDISSDAKDMGCGKIKAVVSKLINERIKTCSGSSTYRKKVSEENFQPIISVIKQLLEEAESLVKKIKDLTGQFVQLAKVKITPLTKDQIDHDVNFIHTNMQEAIELAEALEFLCPISGMGITPLPLGKHFSIICVLWFTGKDLIAHLT